MSYFLRGECKRTHGLATCYRWFDYFRTLCVGVETPTYKLPFNRFMTVLNRCKKEYIFYLNHKNLYINRPLY